MNNPQLYYPIKPHSINQPFGANMNPVYKQQGMLGHNGQDMLATYNQKVYASHDGICFPQVDDHSGNAVVLLSTDKTFETTYCHFVMDSAVVVTNQVVKAGDLIGYADNTGTSTGTHLHFGLRPYPIEWNNGYKGAVDPQPYFNGLYAQDINNPPAPAPKFQFTKTLRFGNWNNDVKQLQTLLKAQNYDIGVVDGIFGNKTLAGIKAFQNANKLVPDGIVGAKTNAVLNTFL
jgi:hypothetical protein